MFDPGGNVWRKVEIEPWKPWFAWRPVRTVSGQRIWLKSIYRRATWHYGGDNGKYARVEYGNVFDLIKL